MKVNDNFSRCSWWWLGGHGWVVKLSSTIMCHLTWAKGKMVCEKKSCEQKKRRWLRRDGRGSSELPTACILARAQLRRRVLSHMSSRILIAYKQTYFGYRLSPPKSNGGEKQQPEIHLRSQTNVPVASLPSPVFTWTNNKCPPQRPPSPTPRVLSWVSWRWSHDCKPAEPARRLGQRKGLFFAPFSLTAQKSWLHHKDTCAKPQTSEPGLQARDIPISSSALLIPHFVFAVELMPLKSK